MSKQKLRAALDWFDDEPEEKPTAAGNALSQYYGSVLKKEVRRLQEYEKAVHIGNALQAETDRLRSTPQAGGGWRPISECPENEPVVFTWVGNTHVGGCVIGRMERNRLRMGGHRRDLFWGGPWAEQTDEHPPTHWMPLPEPPKQQESES